MLPWSDFSNLGCFSGCVKASCCYSRSATMPAMQYDDESDEMSIYIPLHHGTIIWTGKYVR